MLKFVHKVFFLLALAILSLLLNGCDGNNSMSMSSSDNSKRNITDNNTAQPQNAGIVKPDTDAKKANQTVKVTIYHASPDALYLLPEVHAVPKQSANAEQALQLLVVGTANKEMVAVLPQGTKLHGVSIRNHIAYADFTEALVKNSGGGSQTELLIVGAIVNTLTEFPDIHKVQILVDGKKIDTISGHLDISEPLNRFERLIKKST
jgi:spore germination protein GerM